MDRYSEEDILSSVSGWASDLQDIGGGKFSTMESLRDSNSALREWGQEMYNDAEALETERDDLLWEIDELKREVESLKKQLAEIVEE